MTQFDRLAVDMVLRQYAGAADAHEGVEDLPERSDIAHQVLKAVSPGLEAHEMHDPNPQTIACQHTDFADK